MDFLKVNAQIPLWFVLLLPVVGAVLAFVAFVVVRAVR